MTPFGLFVIITFLCLFAIAVALYVYHRLRTSKSPCPHDLCGYKLPFRGLTNENGCYIPEQCPRCDNWVKWDNYKDLYQRIQPPSK